MIYDYSRTRSRKYFTNRWISGETIRTAIETVASWKCVVANDIQMASISTELLPLYLAATWMQDLPSTPFAKREETVLADSYIVLQPLIWISYGYLFTVSLSSETVFDGVIDFHGNSSQILRYGGEASRTNDKKHIRCPLPNFIPVFFYLMKIYRVIKMSSFYKIIK